MSPTHAAVCVVDASTVWTSPSAPRAIDAAAIADQPDLDGWSAALDADARLDLHGRIDTQVRRGEPVTVLAYHGEWLQIAAPWQPTPKDDRGYPGWVRRAHFDAAGGREAAPSGPDWVRGPTADALLETARRLLGARYLWGGLGQWGVDCSGLVHLAFRAAGVIVPRDADAQVAIATPVPGAEVASGDLYFFARPDGFVDHVGFATEPGTMLHAPERGGEGAVEEGPISADRRARLIGAGRLVAS